MNVLVVEDDRINAFILKKFIEKHGEVYIAYKPLQALDILEKENIDIVLMDINLGNNELDGVELLVKIRENTNYTDIPVIATTAYAMTGDDKKLLEKGFDGYIAKPIKKDDLIDKINSILKR